MRHNKNKNILILMPTPKLPRPPTNIYEHFGLLSIIKGNQARKLHF